MPRHNRAGAQKFDGVKIPPIRGLVPVQMSAKHVHGLDNSDMLRLGKVNDWRGSASAPLTFSKPICSSRMTRLFTIDFNANSKKKSQLHPAPEHQFPQMNLVPIPFYVPSSAPHLIPHPNCALSKTALSLQYDGREHAPYNAAGHALPPIDLDLLMVFTTNLLYQLHNFMELARKTRGG